MPLISHGEIVADPWVRLGVEESLPEAGDVIMHYQGLAGALDGAGARTGRLGVALPNTADPRALSALLPKLDLVVLAFPAFTDGRAYSQAWILRNELGFKGELRASGQVLADQAGFMQRCGFDSFETDGRQPLSVWRRAMQAVSLAYQRDYGGGLATRQSAGVRDGVPPQGNRETGYHAAVADLVTRGSAHFG